MSCQVSRANALKCALGTCRCVLGGSWPGGTRAGSKVLTSAPSGACTEIISFPYSSPAIRRESQAGMSGYGYKRLFGPCRRSDRSTPESRPSSGNVRFAPDFVCFTPRCGPPGRCPRLSGFDPERTFSRICGSAGGYRKPVIAVLAQISYLRPLSRYTHIRQKDSAGPWPISARLSPMSAKTWSLSS